jgi:hypothetical protein
MNEVCPFTSAYGYASRNIKQNNMEEIIWLTKESSVRGVEMWECQKENTRQGMGEKWWSGYVVRVIRLLLLIL